MNKSLRGDVDDLFNTLRADAKVCASMGDQRGGVLCLRISEHVGGILTRHPPADGVVVPRDLFEAMRDDQIRYLGAKVMRGLTDGNDELQERIEQADAILSAGDGV